MKIEKFQEGEEVKVRKQGCRLRLILCRGSIQEREQVDLIVLIAACSNT
jgi:hypothetical protein